MRVRALLFKLNLPDKHGDIYTRASLPPSLQPGASIPFAPFGQAIIEIEGDRVFAVYDDDAPRPS